MSKKFYVSPEMDEMALETEGFLAASTDLGDNDPIPYGGDDDSEGDGL